MIINLELKTRKEALYTYLGLLHRFHKLSERELDITVELILSYLDAVTSYGNERAADKLFLDKETRARIIEELGISPQVFRNYLTSLKKKKVLSKDTTLNKVLVPKINGSYFGLTINMKYADI